MDYFFKNTLAFELKHPSAWCLQKEMKQKLFHMHLPTKKYYRTLQSGKQINH